MKNIGLEKAKELVGKEIIYIVDNDIKKGKVLKASTIVETNSLDDDNETTTFLLLGNITIDTLEQHIFEDVNELVHYVTELEANEPIF